MTAERIILEHPVERIVQLFLRHLPRHERALGEIARDERLPHAADRACGEHRPDPIQDGLQRQPAFFRDGDKGLAHESLNLVLRDGEDLCVDGVGVFDAGHGS